MYDNPFLDGNEFSFPSPKENVVRKQKEKHEKTY